MAHLKFRFLPAICFAALCFSELCIEEPSFAQTQPVHVNVDASEAARRLMHATMQFPVKSGPMSLLYPKWIPGEHGPTGPIEDLVEA